MSQQKRKMSADEEPTDSPQTKDQESAEPNGTSTATQKVKRLRHHVHHRSKGHLYYRNLYESGVELDFQELAEMDPEFKANAKLINRPCLDFNDPPSVLQLTKTLLKLDFGLTVTLPDDRLCPPVPNRHKYILWLQRLMETTSYAPDDRPISGLDIGTGASCIYPLLGCTQRENWTFLATDIDPKSLEYARANIDKNNLADRIKLIPRKPTDDMIQPTLEDGNVDSLDFVMVNPPFYESESDMLESAAGKKRPPHSACTGAPVEMVCEGGEVKFVERILQESLQLREKVAWYTSMLGKATSVEKVVGRLKKEAISNYAVTSFVPGKHTRRWAVGWSFRAMRPEPSIARAIPSSYDRVMLPTYPQRHMYLGERYNTEELGKQVDSIGRTLELLSWDWDPEKLIGMMRTRQNVWGRPWRRRKLRGDGGQGTAKECALGVQVRILISTTQTQLSCRWVEGHDFNMFQSFCGYLEGQLKHRDGDTSGQARQPEEPSSTRSTSPNTLVGTPTPKDLLLDSNPPALIPAAPAFVPNALTPAPLPNPPAPNPAAPPGPIDH